MNKIVATVSIIILHLTLNQFLPWWNIIPVVVLIIFLTKLKSKASWLIPSLSVMAIWLIQILWLDQKTGFRSSQRIADIFGAPGIISYLVPILSIGLIAGLSGYLGKLFSDRPQEIELHFEEDMDIDDYKNNTPSMKGKDIV